MCGMGGGKVYSRHKRQGLVPNERAKKKDRLELFSKPLQNVCNDGAKKKRVALETKRKGCCSERKGSEGEGKGGAVGALRCVWERGLALAGAAESMMA